MDDVLQAILSRAELSGTPTFAYEETRRWPDGAFDKFVEIGILREADLADGVWVDCQEGCFVCPDLRESLATGELVGIHNCRRPGCGRLEIPVAQLEQWELDFVGVAKAVRKAVGAKGRYRELAHDRLWHLGHLVRDGLRVELFLGRGLAWPDAGTMLSAVQPLSTADAPVLIGYSRLPTGVTWPRRRPGLHTLASLLDFDKREIVMDRDLLLAVPAGDDGAAVWLTVTEAAALLRGVVSGLNSGAAKTRVSRAVSAGEFRSNGCTGQARLIHRDSFSSWLLEQQAADLDKADDWAAGRQ